MVKNSFSVFLRNQAKKKKKETSKKRSPPNLLSPMNSPYFAVLGLVFLRKRRKNFSPFFKLNIHCNSYSF